MPKKKAKDQSELELGALAEAPKAKVKAVPVFTFDRWFASSGKPAHWKAGMRIFVGKLVKGKRTQAEWERLFAGY